MENNQQNQSRESNALKEQKALIDHEHKLKAPERRKDRRQNSLALILSISATIITALIAYENIKLSKDIADRNSSLEVTSQKLEFRKRADELRKVFYNPKEENILRVSVARELISQDLSMYINKYDSTQANNFVHDYDTRKEIENNIRKEKKTSIDEAIASISTSEQKEAIKDFNQQKQKNTEPRSKEQLIQDEQILITKVPELVETEKDLMDYEQATIHTIELDTESEFSPSSVYWFKEGYFIVHDNLKIALTSLNEDNNSGSLTITSNNKSLNWSFTVPSKRHLDMNGKHYEINFSKIAKAGKNPFNKAVYFAIRELPAK